MGITTMTFLVLFSSVGVAENPCGQLVAALTASLPVESMAEKTEAELVEASETRPCIKTYPWPEGVFWDDTSEERAITADEMRKLRDKVSRLILNHRTFPAMTLSLEDSDDLTEAKFAYRTRKGWDHELLERFGAFLFIRKLQEEERHEEAMREVDAVYSRWAIAARNSRWDEADHATYFSRETHDNLFVLLRFMTLAKLGSETRAEALSVADDFARVRGLLSEEISLLEDPAYELFSSTGCPY